MKEKTAVEILVEELKLHWSKNGTFPKPYELRSMKIKAKNIEKQQIINAHKQGFYSEPFKSRDLSATDYYTKKYEEITLKTDK